MLGGFEGRALSPRGPLPCQVPLHLSLICRKRPPASECAGRCPDHVVTHARAAGQFSQWGQLFQGSGPGSIAGLGGHRLPEQWEEKVLEGSPGSWRQEMSLECSPASPNTPSFCPDYSGSPNVRHSLNERDRSREEARARCHPWTSDSWLWPDP